MQTFRQRKYAKSCKTDSNNLTKSCGLLKKKIAKTAVTIKLNLNTRTFTLAPPLPRLFRKRYTEKNTSEPQIKPKKIVSKDISRLSENNIKTKFVILKKML